MKETKQGVSLIVLVITIIVMIILASAIMISLNNSGIINKANEAVEANNLKEIQNIATLVWSEAYMNNIRDKEDIKELLTAELEKYNVNTNELTFDITDTGVSVFKSVFKVDPIQVDILEGTYVSTRVMVSEDYTDVYVKFIQSNTGASVVIKNYINDGEYRIYVADLVPYEVVNDIVAEVYAMHNGEEVKLVTEPFCVTTYCKSILAKSDAEVDANVSKGAAMKKVAASMLNYIAAVQVTANSNAGNLANDGINFENPFTALTYSDRVEQVNKESTTVKNNAFNIIHGGKVRIVQRIYAQNKEDITVKITSENGPEITRTHEDFDATGNNYYMLYTDNINTKNYKDIYTFKIYEKGELTETITFSIRSFVYVHQNKTAADGTTLATTAKTARALWQYYLAVEEYRAL